MYVNRHLRYIHAPIVSFFCTRPIVGSQIMLLLWFASPLQRGGPSTGGHQGGHQSRIACGESLLAISPAPTPFHHFLLFLLFPSSSSPTLIPSPLLQVRLVSFGQPVFPISFLVPAFYFHYIPFWLVSILAILTA